MIQYQYQKQSIDKQASGHPHSIYSVLVCLLHLPTSFHAHIRQRKMSHDITPLLMSLVTFQDDGGGAGMVTAILLGEGNTAGLETNTAMMGLVAVLLEVPSIVAQLADLDEGAGLDVMPFVHVPSALITQSLVHPIPGVVNSFLDLSDMTSVQGGGGRGEGVCDVVAKATICIGSSEMTSGLGQFKVFVCQLLSEVCQLVCMANDLSTCSSV